MTNQVKNKIPNINILTIKNILRIFAGITANILGLWISYTLKLPIRLNCLGTMYAGCMLGPIGGVLTAVGTTLFALITQKVYIIYIFQAAAVGIICGVFYRRKNHEIVELVNCAFTLCITAAVLDTPMNLLFRRGHSGNLWGDALFDMMTQRHSPIILNSFLDELLVDFPDMILSVFLTAGHLYVAKHYIFHKNTTNKEAS